MLGTIVTAIVALVSAIGGGLLQAWFARRSDLAKFLREEKRQVYQDFLNSWASMNIYPPESSDFLSAKAVFVRTRGRIALIGSHDVIRALARMLENHHTFSDTPSRLALQNVIAAMRMDSLGFLEADIEADLIGLLFGDPRQKREAQ